MSNDETRNPDAGDEGVSDAADVAAESTVVGEPSDDPRVSGPAYGTGPATADPSNFVVAPSAPAVSGDEVADSNATNDDAADNVPA